MQGLELVHNCSKANLSLDQLKTYNLVWSLSGLSMALVTLLLLVGLILSKSYKSPLQRHFLYLTFFTLLDLTNNSLNLIFWDFKRYICEAIGFVDVSIFSTSLLLALGIGLYLLFITYYHSQGKAMPRISVSKAAVVELVYLVGVVSVPPAVLSRHVESFGVAGPLCWIRAYAEGCPEMTANRDLEFKILTTFTTIMAVNVAVFFLLKVILCLLAYRQHQVRAHHVRMARKGSLLVTCLAVTLVINLATLWAHHLGADDNPRTPYAVFILSAILVPSSPVMIPVGIMLYLHSTRKKIRSLRGAAGRLKKRLSSLRRGKSKELLLPGEGKGGGGGGRREEEKQRQYPSRRGYGGLVQQPELPSNTVSREWGYTGAFTDISTTHSSTSQTTCSE